ncbi:MAG: oligopeptide/dipeptide ABC transporter ATP-binding protein [Phycisphaeraceae bacterium]
MNELPAEALLRVEHLKKHFPVHRGVLRREVGTVRAVDDVSFEIRRGKTLGLVGESGCGKTTTSRMILRALEPTAGRILFRRPAGEVVDLASLNRRALRPLRSEIQMVFQDPMASLNPRMTVFELIAEPLRAQGWKRRDRQARVQELMELVGLDPRYLRRYPHAFSGGQRQRIGIARALAPRPSLVVADEPVSALDVSVQAQILNLLQRLRDQLGLTFLFVAHDLSVIRYLCDEVAVMYKGRIVEHAETEALFTHPRHPYTQTLLDAAPTPDPHAPWLEHQPEADTASEPAPAEAGGCAFAARCAHATERCRQEMPVLANQAHPEQTPAHHAACHHAAELTQPGVSAAAERSATAGRLRSASPQ